MKKVLFYCSLALVLMAAVGCKKSPDGTSSEKFYPCNYASFDTHNAIVQQYAREISKQLAK